MIYKGRNKIPRLHLRFSYIIPLFNYILYIIPLLMVMCIQILLPNPIYSQTRGLGLRGLIPPANAKTKKYRGEVVTLDLPFITIKDRKGKTGKVFIGPPDFLQKNRFGLYTSQRLKIWGVPMKVEGRPVIVALKVRDIDLEKEITLRNSQGEPIWWGEKNRAQEQPGRKGRFDNP